MQRREFLHLLAVAASAGWSPLSAASEENLYEVKPFGEVRLLHTTDTHAQLLPLYYREPDANLGLGPFRGKPPHLVGRHLLQKLKLAADSRLAHLLTPVNFNELAHRYGKVGGFAHLASLCRRLRQEYGKEKTLHLDGGDLWQGSATALYTQGRDMVAAANLLGIDIMVGHWEFTYPETVLRANIADFQGDFIAQNVLVREESLFNAPSPTTKKNRPCLPAACHQNRRRAPHRRHRPSLPLHPHRQPATLHPGLDLRHPRRRATGPRRPPTATSRRRHPPLTQRRGLGRHPRPRHPRHRLHPRRPHARHLPQRARHQRHRRRQQRLRRQNPRLPRHRLHRRRPKSPTTAGASCPSSPTCCPPTPPCSHTSTAPRAPYEADLAKTLATTDTLLYRRGNFNGTLDQLIVDALRAVHDSAIALSPGFRWGASILPGPIRLEDLMNATAITYPETYRREMTGDDIKNILESVADNLYHPNPYYRQGGDMVRSGGLRYTLRPAATLGRRIDNLRLPNGDPIQADKRYTVAGWATAQPSPEAPIWEIVSDYLRQQKTVAPRPDLPALSGVADNPGIDGYPSELLL